MSNPLLDAFRAHGGRPGPDGADRAALVRRYAFAVPDDEPLDAICRAAPPAGIVEIGAGLGYWAQLLAERGVDVVAYDRYPPPSTDNTWFTGVEPWHPVVEGDEREVEHHADRLLLLVWPTQNEDWPAEALERFHRAGGTKLAYVGEEAGGATGDARFHKLLGLDDGCVACDYGATNAPCVCDVVPRWEREAVHELPAWHGHADELHLFRRRSRRSTRAV